MNAIALQIRPEPNPTSQADLFQVAASNAGRTLAIRRRLHPSGRDRRRWTGFVFHRKRAWIGQPVVLPNGKVGWIKQAQTGFVCIRMATTDPVDGPIHEYLEATALKPYALPEAVLLGSLKRGKRERTSAVKAAAARRNGAMPVKPGNRPRGRPRKIKQAPSVLSIGTLCAKLRSLLEANPPVS